MSLLDHMDAVAISLGYAVMVIISVSIVAGLVMGAARLSNRAQHALLDTMGGWKTFMEYLKWYRQQRDDEED